MPWGQFALLGIGSYLLANAIFALAYLACGPRSLITTAPGMDLPAFLRAFFFSVETISTIGYGKLCPSASPPTWWLRWRRLPA